MISNSEKRVSFVLRLTGIGLLVSLAATGCSSGESAPANDDDDATEATVGATPGPDETPLTSDDLVDVPDEITAPATLARTADGYVTVPGGREMHESCIQQVGDEDIVDDDANTITHPDGTVEQMAVCEHASRAAPAFSAEKPAANEPPPGAFPGGWMTAGAGDPKYPVTKYWAYWHVPAAPKKSGGQLLYFFNGTQDSGSNVHEILQPVLQWGTSPAGGGAYWGIASWHVYGDHASVSPLKRVHAGDLLWGFGGLGTKGRWQTIAFDTKTGARTTGHFVTHRPQRLALGGVMEIYTTTSCDELPRQHTLVFQSQSWFHGNDQAMDPNMSYDHFGTQSVCGGIHAYKGKNGNVGIRF